SASMIANTVFLPVCVVCMARSKGIDQISVVAAPRICVAHHQGARRAGGVSFKHAGENFNGIRLLTLGHVAGRARLSSVEIFLDVFSRKRKTRWATIDDTSHGRSVTFTERGNHENVTERIAGHAD